jgi:hypothetical protein
MKFQQIPWLYSANRTVNWYIIVKQAKNESQTMHVGA